MHVINFPDRRGRFWIKLRRWLKQLPPDKWVRIASLAATFYLEASVLLFVFPILDRIIDKGVTGLTWPWVIGSLLFSIAMFILAVVVSLSTPEVKKHD